MNSNRQIAIDSVGISKLIVSTNDYVIKIKNIFNEIEEIIREVSTYYECYSMKCYINNFNEFKSNFQVMINNLLSYKKDLQVLNEKFGNQQSILSQSLSDETRKVQSKKIN